MKIQNRGQLSELIRNNGVETNKVHDEAGVELYHTIIYNKKTDRHYRIEWGEIVDKDNISHLWYESEAKKVTLNKSPWIKGWFTKEELKEIDLRENNKKSDLNLNFDNDMLHNVENNLVILSEQNDFTAHDNMELVGGKTGKGKTLYSIRKAVEKLIDNKSVLFFSTEEQQREIIRKMVLILKNDTFFKQISDRDIITDNDRELEALKFLKNSKLNIDDNDLLHTNYIVNKMRELKESDSGLDYVVIDGLHIISSGNENVERHNEMKSIYNALELAGDELNSEILITTQLNARGEMNIFN